MTELSWLILSVVSLLAAGSSFPIWRAFHSGRISFYWGSHLTVSLAFLVAFTTRALINHPLTGCAHSLSAVTELPEFFAQLALGWFICGFVAVGPAGALIACGVRRIVAAITNVKVLGCNDHGTSIVVRTDHGELDPIQRRKILGRDVCVTVALGCAAGLFLYLIAPYAASKQFIPLTVLTHAVSELYWITPSTSEIQRVAKLTNIAMLVVFAVANIAIYRYTKRKQAPPSETPTLPLLSESRRD